MAVTKCKKANGNCTLAVAPDGFAVQCVGPWGPEKHDYVQRYIDATHGPRSKFLPPNLGGAAFLDLFAGPGLARVRTTGAIVDGSPLRAMKHSVAPFTKLIYGELDEENLAALKARTGHDARTQVIPGDSNANAVKIAAALPKYGLNLAFVDPYGLKGLHFATIKTLAANKRLDLIINFPTGDMKRNFDHNRNGPDIDVALGTKSWRATVTRPSDIPKLIELFKAQLVTVGYTATNVRSVEIKNNRNVTLYYIVFASKHALADKIWESITRISATGQTRFPGT